MGLEKTFFDKTGGEEGLKDRSFAYGLAGGRAADAAEAGAALQAESGREALALTRETRDLARSDLRPFVNFATGSIGGGQGASGPTVKNQTTFDPDAYLQANPDVARDPYWGANPYQHYLQHGNAEGRQFTASSTGANGYAADSPMGMLSNLFTQQGQTDYLSNNPLFKFGMEKLDRASNNAFLGRGQVGSANNQIVQNAFLAGQPLLQQQTGNLFNAVNIGQSSAAGQANTALNTGSSSADLLTGIGNARAAGGIGAANATTQGASNVAGIGVGLLSAFSDRRLKRNITRHGTHGKYQTYAYQYVWGDDWYVGVMADEVKAINPGAVSTHISGFDIVNYGAL